MTTPVVVRCRAKINPVLLVLGQRSDGFHDLDLEFVSLELHDLLTLRPDRGFSLSVEGARPSDVPVEDNLVLRAARALQRELGESALPGATLVLEKRIPAAAGLGGGSSDAAGTLLGLCRLLGLTPAQALLERLALDLGSDVPYFLRGGRQRGLSRGEKLQQLPDRPERPVLLVRPRLPLSTREVFESHARRARQTGEGPQGPTLTSRKTGTSFQQKSWWTGDEVVPHDDLWEAAVEIAPGLADLRQRLRACLDGVPVGMTGSGPTLFALLAPGASEASLGPALERLASPDIELILTRTVGATEYGASLFQ